MFHRTEYRLYEPDDHPQQPLIPPVVRLTVRQRAIRMIEWLAAAVVVSILAGSVVCLVLITLAP